MTNTFPQIFKISRILPFSKPNKPRSDIDSYRPINNLMCIEKIFEEYFKECLIIFLNENNIINKDPHGALLNHSTTTAITILNN